MIAKGTLCVRGLLLPLVVLAILVRSDLAGRAQAAGISENVGIQVLPGDQIPALPRNVFKARVDYAVTDAWKVGGDMQFVGSQYFAADESNQFPKLPSYTVFNLHTSYQVTKTVQLYARADNVLDNRYATYGTFFDTTALPNFSTGNAFTDPRSLSPARPRALYAGMKITF